MCIRDSPDLGLGIRAVTSIDGMTADFAQIPWDVLQKISVRIVNEVKQVKKQGGNDVLLG